MHLAITEPFYLSVLPNFGHLDFAKEKNREIEYV